jgi:hypothetical protein
MKLPVRIFLIAWFVLPVSAMAIGSVSVFISTIGWEKLRAADPPGRTRSGASRQQDWSVYSRIGLGAVGASFLGIGAYSLYRQVMFIRRR